MATYKEIQGAAVQALASSTGTLVGQIWYDTANNLFKDRYKNIGELKITFKEVKSVF